jgi:hypothetical protein
VPKVKGQLVQHSEGDEKLIRRLGMAVALQWADLPERARDRILRQAWTVFDAEPVSSRLKQELQAFVQRHQLSEEALMPRGPKGEKHPKQPTDEEMKERAIGRWNNEGRAPAPAKRPKRPPDPKQLGKMIVDLSVGEAKEVFADDPPKNEAAAALGRMSGKARTESLSKKRRAEIARKAAKKR